MICLKCGEGLNLKALESGGGWYVGRACRCGPHSRETRTYLSEVEARQHPLLSLESAWLEMVLEQRAAVRSLEEAERELGIVLEDLPLRWRVRTARALTRVRAALGELRSGPNDADGT